ncbi:MAG: hypothetical protein NW226_03285 [Microscillaceae bacterium]|nr:hypothetical protein [Microscillaceae bacterium]
MNSTKKLKLGIIEMLIKVNDLNILTTVHHQLANAAIFNQQTEKPLFWKAVKSIRKKVSLQEIMNEQNYVPITYQEFRTNADELLWEETLEDLLETIR